VCLLQGAPTLLLHNVVCPLPFYISGRIGHVVTNVELFHGQGMLHVILEDGEHGFVHGVGVALSI
jgi:hypothetical protein